VSEFPTIEIAGETRILNLQPSDPAQLWLVGAGAPVLPKSEIRDFDRWPAQITIKDQNGRGACNGHATVTALEFARAMQGQPHVGLSAWYVYSILCGGWDRGSNILDALKLVQANGAAPESLVEYKLINPKRLTAEANKAALRFRLTIGRQLTTWDEILSAVALRRSLNLSIHVGTRFGSIDSEGVPGVGRGMGNHAVMCGGGIKTSPKWGKLIRMANSWSTAWGQNGFCWLSQAHIEGGSWFECFEVDAVSEDLVDDNNPPEAIA
jgi:hypothetical protein